MMGVMGSQVMPPHEDRAKVNMTVGRVQLMGSLLVYVHTLHLLAVR